MAFAKRATVYDSMENKGVFASNPANQHAVADNGDRISKWPLELPCMLYHPKGEEREVDAGYYEDIKGGRTVHVNQKFATINKIVNTQEEYDEAIAEGWHTTPGAAMVAAGKKAPPMSPMNQAKSDAARIAELEAKLAALEGAAAPAPTDGTSPPAKAGKAGPAALGL